MEKSAHVDIWWAYLEIHAFPQLGNRHIDALGAADVLEALSPVWTEKQDTARRVRQCIAAIFDWAKAAGHYQGENPTNGLMQALPAMKRKRTHMAAMDWREVPAFMSDLAQRDGVFARTLEFFILTATHSGAARGARWSEIQGGVWAIPAERKRGVEYRIPLTGAALSVLERVSGLSNDLISVHAIWR